MTIKNHAPVATGIANGRSATPLVAGMVALALVTIGYFAAGMPGMDHSTATTGHDMSPHSAHRVLDPEKFEQTIINSATVTINVHVPVGDIALDGTDLTMAFDDLDPTALPSDRATPLAIYCRSGTMSAVAARGLLALGYNDIVELDGGTESWTASGRTMSNDAAD